MGNARHVCLFPGELQLGGVGRNTLNLAEEFLKRGVRVDLFLSRRAGYYVPLIPDGVRIVEGKGSVKASVPCLIRYLHRERPQLLISARPYINIAAIVAARIAGAGTRVVITERTATVTDNRALDSPRRRLIRRLSRWLYPHADQVVAVSGAVAAELSQAIGLRADRIRVIYNPVVTDRLRRSAEAPIDDPWLDTSGAPLILGVGRFCLQKDFGTLVRAFAEVRSTVDARLAILGEGEDRKSLEGLVADLGLQEKVYLPGYVENPFAWMARADVFVLSSRWEGLPTALIEAMATGTPVVSTDCPGGSREILADGEYGALTPVGDALALADAIRSTMEGPPPPGLLEARAGDFSAEVSAERYLGLIDD